MFFEETVGRDRVIRPLARSSDSRLSRTNTLTAAPARDGAGRGAFTSAADTLPDGRRLPPVRALTPDRSSPLGKSAIGKASRLRIAFMCDFAICSTSASTSLTTGRARVARRDAGCGREAQGESLGYSSPFRSHDTTAPETADGALLLASLSGRRRGARRSARRSHRRGIIRQFHFTFVSVFLCPFQSPTAASARLKDSRRRAGPPER